MSRGGRNLVMSRNESCVSAEDLEAYVLGTSVNRREVEMHGMECADCRDRMVALGLALHPGTAEEEAEVRSILAMPSPAPTPIGSRSRVMVVASAVAACAAGLLLVVSPRGGTPAALLVPLADTERPIEARTSVEVPWAPYRPTRGQAGADRRYDRVLGRLLQGHQHGASGSTSALAVFYLWRAQEGDDDRARRALDELPATPEAENDRGVLELSRGRTEAALDLFGQALQGRSDLLPAMFNRAIALERLGRRADAVVAWEKYIAAAGSRDSGWIAEASGHLSALRER